MIWTSFLRASGEHMSLVEGGDSGHFFVAQALRPCGLEVVTWGGWEAESGDVGLGDSGRFIGCVPGNKHGLRWVGERDIGPGGVGGLRTKDKAGQSPKPL